MRTNCLTRNVSVVFLEKHVTGDFVCKVFWRLPERWRLGDVFSTTGSVDKATFRNSDTSQRHGFQCSAVVLKTRGSCCGRPGFTVSSSGVGRLLMGHRTLSGSLGARWLGPPCRIAPVIELPDQGLSPIWQPLDRWAPCSPPVQPRRVGRPGAVDSNGCSGAAAHIPTSRGRSGQPSQD